MELATALVSPDNEAPAAVPPQISLQENLSAVHELTKSFPIPTCVHATPLPCVTAWRSKRRRRDDASAAAAEVKDEPCHIDDDNEAEESSAYTESMVCNISESFQLLGGYSRGEPVMLADEHARRLTATARLVYDALLAYRSATAGVRSAGGATLGVTEPVASVACDTAHAPHCVKEAPIVPRKTWVTGQPHSTPKQANRELATRHSGAGALLPEEVGNIEDTVVKTEDTSGDARPPQHVARAACPVLLETHNSAAVESAATSSRLARGGPLLSDSPNSSLFHEEFPQRSLLPIIRACDISNAALQTWSHFFAMDSRPFREVDPDGLRKYLQLLVSDVNGGRVESKTEVKAERDTKGGCASAGRRMTACVACVGHPQFDEAWLDPSVVDAVIAMCFHHLQTIRRTVDEGVVEVETGTDRRAPITQTAQGLFGIQVEELRATLQGLTAIASNRRLHSVDDSKLLRLEEVGYQAVFTISNDFPKVQAATYALFVHSAAVELYMAVWGRLSASRDEVLRSIFHRLPSSHDTLERSFALPSGEKVMPLTVMLLVHAQVVPVAQSTGAKRMLHSVQHGFSWAHGARDQLQSQCRAVASLCAQYLCVAGEGEASGDASAWPLVVERGHSSQIVAALIDDLSAMIGMPEYSGADLLLHALLVALAREAFPLAPSSAQPVTEPSGPTQRSTQSSSTKRKGGVRRARGSRGATEDGQGECDPSLTGETVEHHTSGCLRLEKLRPFVVDAIGRVAARLCASEHVRDISIDAAAEALMPSSVPEVEPLPRSAGDCFSSARVSTAQLEEWRRITASPPESVEREDAAGVVGAGEVPPVQVAQCGVYFVLSRQASSPEAVSASFWRSVRLTHILSWSLLCGSADPRLTDEAIAALVEGNPTGSAGAVDPSWGELNTLTRCISASLGRSLLHRNAKEMLISLLLSVFRSGEFEGPGCDQARKRSLVHLSSLIELYPPLAQMAWPIALRCIRDDNARVRESSLPLLQTLLQSYWRVHSHAAEAATVVTNVFSSLLHLLSDRSTLVVSRTIQTLEAFLTSPAFESLFVTPTGQSLLCFIETKLLAVSSDRPDGRHGQQVLQLFARRWLAGGGGNVDELAPRAGMTTELIRLVRSDLSSPFEMPETHPLVLLLRGMVASSMDTGARTSTAEKRGGGYSRRRTSALGADALQLTHAMRLAAKELWMSTTQFAARDKWAPALAVLHAFSLASIEWVEPLIEPLMQCVCHYSPHALQSAVQLPLATDDKGTTDAQQIEDDRTTEARAPAVEQEIAAVMLLQANRILRTVLLSPRIPSFSTCRLAHSLTELLSRYVGAHQQKVLLAACGTLSAMITSGGNDGQLSTRVNHTDLKRCYALMNSYYVRVSALVPTLATAPGNTLYALRFLFLLSEFLRLYPGWQHPQPSLEGGGVTGAIPNRLAAGGDLCENVQRLLTDVIVASPRDAAHKTTAVVLRAAGSLCMLRPATFFRRNEALIQRALAAEVDVACVIQGLTLLKDFLADEDARAEAASHSTGTKVTTSPCRQQSPAGLTTGSRDLVGEEPQTRRAKRGHPNQRDRIAKMEASVGVGGNEVPISTRQRLHEVRPGASDTARLLMSGDQTSGMATWLMQQFASQVKQLCEHPSQVIRTLAFDVVELAIQQGLLPPAAWTVVLVVLAADPKCESLRQRAERRLAAVAETHEASLLQSAHLGIAQSYFLHIAEGCNPFLSPILPPTKVGAERSIHGGVFGLLGKNKKQREGMLAALTRYFYQQSKLTGWLTACQALTGSRSVVPPGQPLSFLLFLTSSMAYLPFLYESDVLYLNEQCGVGIDLVGECSLDFLHSVVGTLTSEKSGGRRKVVVQNKHSSPDAPSFLLGEATPDCIVEVTKCFGTVLLHILRAYLRREFGLAPSKLHRYSAGAYSGHVPLLPREPSSPASQSLLQQLTTCAQAVNPLVTAWMQPSLMSHTSVHYAPPTAAAVEKANAAVVALCGIMENALDEERQYVLHSDITGRRSGSHVGAIHTSQRRRSTPAKRARTPSEQSQARVSSSASTPLSTPTMSGLASSDSSQAPDSDESAASERDDTSESTDEEQDDHF